MSSEEHRERSLSGENSHNVGYERSDVSLKLILLVGLAIVVTVAVIVVFLSDLFISSREKVVYEQVLKPESISLRELRAQETEILNSYAVIDTVKGIYRIPIARAMEILAEEAFSAEFEQQEDKN